ncbi:MAG: DUF92 domain-containing protein [candidate division KSB1 bacterium]|nr:DUF92 domain-containing protein [candidate division KSB1 bacterium]
MASLVAFLAAVEWLSRKFSAEQENVRKMVHFATGLAVLPTPFLFRTYAPMMIISLLFAVANAWSIRSGKIGVYNRSERRSLGTVYYPLALAVLLPLFWREHPALLLIPFALMAFGDPVAGMVGVRARQPMPLPPPWDQKSVRGSLAMFGASAIIVLAGLSIDLAAFGLAPGPLVLIALAVGAVAAAAEALSLRGSDNLSVPLLSAAMLKMLLTPGLFRQTLIGELLALMIVAAALRLRALDTSGAIAAFLVGTFIFAVGGWPMSLPLIVFFVTSSLLSKWTQWRKAADTGRYKAVSHRDAKQVLSNGGLPMLLAIISIWLPHPMVFFLYLAGVAAAAADTWATEIGLLSAQTPRSIVSGKPVLPGASGGITLPGLIGAAAGSAAVSFSVLLTPSGTAGPISGSALLWVALAGFLANLLDSVLGATLQRKSTCAVCGLETEHLHHCNTPTRHVAGLRWLDNDGVNLACSLGGILIAAILI